jgi:hypothetical protein
MMNEVRPMSDLSRLGNATECPSPGIDDEPLNLHEYETAAQTVLPAMNYDYIARGAADEVTLQSNRLAFDRWRLLPRVLRGGTCRLAISVLVGAALPGAVRVREVHLEPGVDAELGVLR